ncbi:hypothetical protein [Bdellovibrio bacteriovorus]|uniref:hypothetical protein n=1 Tax=Bdellovibrio TaxID=958 RepID=UPI0035A875D3
MKSMFRSSPGLRRLAATFFLTTFVSSGGHAIFIRGNGGFAVMENGVWYAHDTYEWHSLDIYFLPRYSKEAFPRGKVTDYIFNLPSPLKLLHAYDIFNSLVIEDCSTDDYRLKDTDYTFLNTMTKLEESLTKKNPQASYALAAINFYNPETHSYRVCKTPFFSRLDNDQKAILLFHEVVYIYLEKNSSAPPTADQVREVVVKTLKQMP